MHTPHLTQNTPCSTCDTRMTSAQFAMSKFPGGSAQTSSCTGERGEVRTSRPSRPRGGPTSTHRKDAPVRLHDADDLHVCTARVGGACQRQPRGSSALDRGARRGRGAYATHAFGAEVECPNRTLIVWLSCEGARGGERQRGTAGGGGGWAGAHTAAVSVKPPASVCSTRPMRDTFWPTRCRARPASHFGTEERDIFAPVVPACRGQTGGSATGFLRG